MIASYDPDTATVDMVPGSAWQASSLAAPGNGTLYPGSSNLGVGGWNQVGCLIYDVIPSKNRPTISVNQGSSNVWFLAENWDNYVLDWPSLAQTYYKDGGWYCPKPPVLNYNAPGPCEAFPCTLGRAPDTPASINYLIHT